ncbi:unnamed protein product [Cylicostephanus goldi]|uniref:Uncharacterized protein n=1 Tax=Cylicostephanus goldi TaxID=71465 RepID=A0A3P7NM45_CYLGO|nr:unnamed protein product [Cylicostephanus goldi]
MVELFARLLKQSCHLLRMRHTAHATKVMVELFVKLPKQSCHLLRMR